MGIKYYIYIIFLLPAFLFAISVTDFQSTSTVAVNMEFRIPAQIDSSDFFSFFKRKKDEKTYRVALLLPFCVDSNQFIFNTDIDSLILENTNQKDVDFYKKTQISTDFYFGFLMSLENFKDVNLEISLFDVKEDDESKFVLNNLINQNHLTEMDFIVGPLYESNFKYFSNNFAFDVPLICPLSKKDGITNNNENVFQIESNMIDYLPIFSEYIFKTHRKDNILLVRRDTIFEKIKQNNQLISQPLLDTIIPVDIKYANALLHDINTTSFNFKEIKVSGNIIDSIHHHLDTLGMKNVVIVGSDDNAFVTDLLSKLHAARDTSLVVYGLPTLSDFDHMSIMDLMDMNVTFPHNKFDSDSLSDQFLIDFYNNYNYLPSFTKYASVGYEIGLYFFGILFEHGSIFPYSSKKSERVLETVYDFKKLKDGGYKNQGFIILRYDDYRYKQIY